MRPDQIFQFLDNGQISFSDAFEEILLRSYCDVEPGKPWYQHALREPWTAVGTKEDACNHVLGQATHRYLTNQVSPWPSEWPPKPTEYEG